MIARKPDRPAAWRRLLISRRWADRRWLYVIIVATIAIPLRFPLGLEVSVRPAVRGAHEAITAVPVGGRVLVLADFGPAAEPELRPFLEALRGVLRSRQVGVVSLSLWPAAPPLVNRVFGGEEGGRYGADFVNLGFKEGRAVLMQKVGESIPNTYPTDSRGTPLVRLPLMDGIEQLGDFDLVIGVSGGVPGALEWLAQVQGRFVDRMVVAAGSSLAPDLLPFVESGQLVGLIDGLSGAAQFETLVGRPGAALTRIESLSFAHLALALLMILACGESLWRRRRVLLPEGRR